MNALITIRPAVPNDSADLADLMNLAGDGIPLEVWTALAAPGEDPLALGRARARRTEGAFSHTHAWVAETAGRLLGMAFGYPLGDEATPKEVLASLPVNVRPFVELEASAPGSFYLNGLAVRAEARRRGVGHTLLEGAFARAAERGCPTVSLTMFEHNRPAAALYRARGFVEVARRPPLADPNHAHQGAPVLLVAPVAAR